MEEGKEQKKPDPKTETDAILKRRKVDGHIVVAMIAGSAAYNLRRDDGGSDFDFLAVYCAPPMQFWGLHQPQARVTSKPGQSPDIQVVEAAAFCNALLNANPTFVEMLWVEQNCWWDKLDEDELEVKVPRWRAGSEIAGCWDYLRANRKRFLTKELVKQYLGFARGQIKQVETKPETNRKKIYNALRLLLEAKRVVAGGEPRVWVDGEEREFLMSVRREEKELNDYIEYGKRLIKDIEAEEPWPKLSACTEEDWLNDWLLVLRRSAMREANFSRSRSDSLLSFENFG